MNIYPTEFFSNVFVQILLIVILAIIIHKASSIVVEKLVRKVVRKSKFKTRADEVKREDTLIHVFSAAAGLTVWLVAAASILNALNFNLATIATGAGVVGLVIGLGAQSTIKDFLAGIFILLENQYRVGDIVTLSGGTTGLGTSGVVEEITLRITKMRDLDGTLNIVRNGEAAIITNRTFEYSSVVVDVGVSYESDIDLVEKVMNRVGRSMFKDQALASDIIEPITFLRVDGFTAYAVTAKAVGKVKPSKQWGIAGEYRRRLLKAFAEEGIIIALPQVVAFQNKSKKNV